MTNKKDKYKSFLNYSKGKYSYKDYLVAKKWFSQFDANEETEDYLFAQWVRIFEAGSGKQDSLDHIYDTISSKVISKEDKKVKRINFMKKVYKAAIVLLIPVLAFSIWYHIISETCPESPSQLETKETWIEISALEGAKTEFLLKDGTRGWLNGGSILRYPADFCNERKVKLDGEAWFDVKHLGGSEFVVDVTDIEVKVLGTQFSVSAYTEDDYTDVILEEGKVEIKGLSGEFNQTLEPDEKASVNRISGSVQLSKVDARRFSAWKEGYLVIDNEALGKVISRLERWYNVQIAIEDEILRKYRFRATFKDEPIEDILLLIAKTTPIIYTIKEPVLNEKGMLEKKKITIKLKQ